MVSSAEKPRGKSTIVGTERERSNTSTTTEERALVASSRITDGYLRAIMRHLRGRAIISVFYPAGPHDDVSRERAIVARDRQTDRERKTL